MEKVSYSFEGGNLVIGGSTIVGFANGRVQYFHTRDELVRAMAEAAVWLAMLREAAVEWERLERAAEDPSSKPLPENEAEIAGLALWRPGAVFTSRELRLIANAQVYANNDPAGLPGHSLMVIVDKLEQLLGMMAGYLTETEVEACVQALSSMVR